MCPRHYCCPLRRINGILGGMVPAGALAAGLATALLLVSCACEVDFPATRLARLSADDRAPCQSDEEGVGAAVAILLDTSGSMREVAPGDTRPNLAAARESLEAARDATHAFVARLPGCPSK